MSARGDYLALQLARLGVPVSDAVRKECARVARIALRVTRLEEEHANGPDDRTPVWDIEEWQTKLERDTECALDTLRARVVDLCHAVARADSDGTNRFIAGWESSLYGVALTVYRAGATDDPRIINVVE